MATIKVQYDSMDEVPTEHAALYTERDGKAFLTGVEGLRTDADLNAIKAAAAKERTRSRELLARAAKLGDRDPEELLRQADEAKDLKAELEEIRSAGVPSMGAAEDAIAKRVSAALAREVNPLKREMDKIKAERDAAQAAAESYATTIRTSTLRSELTRAAVEAKVRGEALDDVLMYQSIFEVGDDGKPVTRDGVGVTPGLSPSVWITEMKEKRAHWWPEATGGGARGSGGGASSGTNPFKRETFNLAQCGDIAGRDPAKAEQLARLAGHASVAAAMAAAGRAVGR
jgi:hypothetical protein